MPVDNVRKIGGVKKARQILCLVLGRFHGQAKRHTAVVAVHRPRLVELTSVNGVKLRKIERKNADFVPSSAKFRNNVARQKLGIAAGNVYIGIGNMHKPVYYTFEVIDQLNFVQQDVVIVAVRHTTFNIRVQLIGILQFFVAVVVQRKKHNVVFRYTARQQMLLEKF